MGEDFFDFIKSDIIFEVDVEGIEPFNETSLACYKLKFADDSIDLGVIVPNFKNILEENTKQVRDDVPTVLLNRFFDHVSFSFYKFVFLNKTSITSAGVSFSLFKMIVICFLETYILFSN